MFHILYGLSRASSSQISIQCFLKNPTLVRSITSASTSHNSFTVSYLINSCGLSQEKAISASKNVRFETSVKPDSVLTFFRNHEISNTHISKIIQIFPRILLSDANKTLKPKIDFLNSLGFSGPELSKILYGNPFFLTCSLKKRILPSFAFLKSVVHTDTDITKLLKKSTWVLTNNLQVVLTPNIDVLRALGVPDNNISMLLVMQPRALLLSINKFKSLAQDVATMGFDPSKRIFCQGIRRLTSLSEATKDAKIGVYKKWGWSEKEIYGAFRKEPTCLALSKENIMLKMNFFVEKMGYDPLLIAEYPAVLAYSFEKRIIPRAEVIHILISKGLLEKNDNLYYIFKISDKDFLKKFVFKYEGEVPELVNAYKRKTSGLEPYGSCV